MSTELLARIDKNRVYCLTYDYDFRGTEYLPFTLIQDECGYYWSLFEYPYGSRGNETGEPAWYEYLLWQPMNNNRMYPKILGYKYYADEENDKQVEAWLNRGDKS